MTSPLEHSHGTIPLQIVLRQFDGVMALPATEVEFCWHAGEWHFYNSPRGPAGSSAAYSNVCRPIQKATFIRAHVTPNWHTSIYTRIHLYCISPFFRRSECIENAFNGSPSKTKDTLFRDNCLERTRLEKFRNASGREIKKDVFQSVQCKEWSGSFHKTKCALS